MIFLDRQEKEGLKLLVKSIYLIYITYFNASESLYCVEI